MVAFYRLLQEEKEREQHIIGLSELSSINVFLKTNKLKVLH